MNATTMDVEAAAEDIVAAIEAATAARRTDECCRADAMLQIYGVGTSTSSNTDSSSGGIGPGTPTTTTDPGSPGMTAAGDPCVCEEVNAVEILPIANGTMQYPFAYNTCEGFSEIVEYDDPLTGAPLSQTVTRDAICIPETVLVGGDCDCEMLTLNYVEYDSNGAVSTISEVFDTCVGVVGEVTYVEYEGGAEGYCNMDLADTSVYASPSITAAQLDNAAGTALGICPPLVPGQELFTDVDGNQFYKAIASSKPSVPISCPAPAVEEQANCERPCDEFGQPLLNGDGSEICCASKDGQTILAAYKNKCGEALYFSNNPAYTGTYVFDENTGLYNIDSCGVIAGSQPPLNGTASPGLATPSTGTGEMFGAYVYACEAEELDEVGGLFSGFFKAEVDCGDPQTLTESYTQQWCQYLKCQAAYQNWMTGVLGVQVVASLYYAVEAQKCLNEILDDQKTLSSIAVDDIQNLKACSDVLINQQDGLLKQCQQELLKGYVNRIGISNDVSSAICESGEDIWDCFSQMYKPWNEATVPALYETLAKVIGEGDLSAESLSDWGQTMDHVFTDCFLPEMKREFLCLLDSANHSATNINDWRDQKRCQALELKDHYNRVYKSGEGDMIPAIMDMSRCMVEKVCEFRNYLAECGERDICDWRDHHREQDHHHARESYAVANKGFDGLANTLQWLDANVYAFQQLAKCYETGEMQLSSEVFNQTNQLAPEICKAYMQFESQRIEYSDFWDTCWKDRTCKLVKHQLDLACQLVDSLEESVERVMSFSRQGEKNFKEWYAKAESETAPKAIWAGNKSIDVLERTSCLFEEQTKKFRDIWECDILPCDMQDLQKHCEVWCYTNPLKDINETSDDVKHLEMVSREAYEASVYEAQCLLEELRQESEKFDYCVEDQALLHVRAQFDKAEEELIRCNSRYCGGFMAEGLVRLKTERAKAEGGAFEAANRWKWWANEQLDDRRYNRQSDLLKIMSGYGSQALSAAQVHLSANGQLLESINRTLSRVYTYLDRMDSAGSQVTAVNSQLMQSMQNMIQMGHFWPQYALSSESAALSAEQAMINSGQSVMEQGHFYLERETWATLNGSNFLSGMLDLGNNTTNLGRYWTDQAVRANERRGVESREAVRIGSAASQMGQERHRMGVAKIEKALDASISAPTLGLSATEIGQRYSAKSLDSQSECIDNALQHMTLANNIIATGLDFMSNVQNAYQSSSQQGALAQNALLNLLQESRLVATQSLGFREACFKENQEMLWKTKEFLQQNFLQVQRGIHGNTLNSLDGISNQLQNTFDNNLSDVFAGLTALGGNLTTAPVPYSIPNIGGF